MTAVLHSIAPASFNPLLSVLPAEMKKAEVEAWLDHGERRQLADASQVRGWLEDGLVVTPQAVSIAAALLKMMRRSAHDQDPRILDNRRRAISGAPHKGWRPPTAAGLCIAGDTGVGKSHIVQHVLQLVPQVVDHGPNDDADMLGLLQLVHLTIQLSGDGTPKAFFLNAICEMDRALGTEYASASAAVGKSSRNTVMSYFMQQLKKHRVLLLVIEEGQLKNLGNKKFRKILDDLVIQLMNYGIPVAVLGNPLGIDMLKKESQAQRRLCSDGDFRIDPAFHWNDPLWKKYYVPEIWDPTPLHEPDEVKCPRKDLERLLWQATGGFPGLLARLREIALCNALERGGTRVDHSDLLQALTSPEYAGNHALAEPYVKRNAALLGERFNDVKTSYYSEIWERLRQAEARRKAVPDHPKGIPNPPQNPPQEPREAPPAAAATQPPKAPRQARAKTPSRAGTKKVDGGHEAPAPQDARSEDWVSKQPKSVDRDAPSA